MISQATQFVRLIGSIVASICDAIGPAWEFIVWAVTILFILALFKQIGYRNGD